MRSIHKLFKLVRQVSPKAELLGFDKILMKPCALKPVKTKRTLRKTLVMRRAIKKPDYNCSAQNHFQSKKTYLCRNFYINEPG